MQTKNRSISTPNSTSNARGALALGLLVAVTLAASVAARGWRETEKGSHPLPLVAPGGGPVHFTARLDRTSVLRGADGIVRLELTIRGDAAESGPAARMPTDLVVVFDRSGSMAGDPIEFARAAVQELVAQVGPEDRFALVSYASDARVDVPLATVGGVNRASVLAAISSLQATGGTNMSSGLDLATALVAGARSAGRAPRVVLLSDGHANEGDASRVGLAARAGRAVADEFVLSAVGVGDGFDEALMSGLADAGTGNFYYLRDARALGGVFAGEFAAARETLASGLLVRIDPVRASRCGRGGVSLERDGGIVSFRPGALFAGQERRVWVSFRVPTSGDGSFPLGAVALDFSQDGARRTLRLDDMPSIALAESEKDYLASVDRSAWEQGVLEDELGQLKQRVSQAIQAGDRARAASEVHGYVSRNAALGAALRSEAVEGKLDEVRALGAQVDAAFAPSPRAPALQNQLRKQLAAEGRDDRRVGSKKP